MLAGADGGGHLLEERGEPRRRLAGEARGAWDRTDRRAPPPLPRVRDRARTSSSGSEPFQPA
jgi:hypothetical protein